MEQIAEFFSSAAGGSPADIVGTCSAYIILTWVDVAVAQACLLPNVQLAPPPGTPFGKHPVVYCFGFQQGVRRRDDIVEDDYNEALVELPFVTFRHQDGSVSGPYFQMTALRVDSELAYKLGVALGFPKQLAIMDVTDTTYSIQMQEGANPVMSGIFTPSPYVAGRAFPKYLSVVQLLMLQPVISQTPEGDFLLTTFHLDFQHAIMFPAEAAFTAADNSIAGLPQGDYEFPGIYVTAFGGCFHSVHNWVMSQPSQIMI